MFFHKKASHNGFCMFLHLLVAALLLIVAIAAFVGVLQAHILPEGEFVFGTSTGSLSLIAFSLTLVCWMKSLKGCVGPCEVCAPVGKKK